MLVRDTELQINNLKVERQTVHSRWDYHHTSKPIRGAFESGNRAGAFVFALDPAWPQRSFARGIDLGHRCGMFHNSLHLWFLQLEFRFRDIRLQVYRISVAICLVNSLTATGGVFCGRGDSPPGRIRLCIGCREETRYKAGTYQRLAGKEDVSGSRRHLMCIGSRMLINVPTPI